MATETFKRLSYGISNFEDIITGNYAYVDKTRYIELLEQENNPYQFFIRPRKFGKSLFFSLLSNYYDFNKAGRFEELFGSLYIGRHPTPKKNAYALITFNFSGINTASGDDFKVSFSNKIDDAVRLFFALYGKLIPDVDVFVREIAKDKKGIDSLEVVYRAAKSAHLPLFAIIDEYDHFANDLIAIGTNMGEDVYRRMVHANGLVRDFYETLKIGTSDVLKRIFITGISPVMLDDLTSGFNVADNLTLECKYNEMMGFTREEVESLRKETGIDASLINIDIEPYYDGYLFHENGKSRIYNPSMILYLFNQIAREKKPPRKIIDDNLKTDYGRLQRLVQNERNRGKLMEIVKHNGIASEIISQFSVDRMYSDEYFVSLLFYMGLLTIDRYEYGTTYLKIPNYSIQTIYWEYIERITVEMNKDVAIDPGEQRNALRELAYKGNPYPYVEYVSRNIFSRLSNRDLMCFDEKYIKIMLLNGLFQSNLYIPVSEKEVDSGYVDIYLKRSPLLPDIPYEWLWEIKYVKKSETASLPLVREKAKEQVKRYLAGKETAGRKDLKGAVLLFTGKDTYEIIC